MVADVFEPLSRKVVHVGGVDAAATLKVANNLVFSVINAVTAEALLLAKAAGLDPGVFVDIAVDSGAATVNGLFRSIAPRAVDGDFAPMFSLDLVRKDNDLAVRLAASLGLELSVGLAARDLRDRAVVAGHGAEDSVAALRLLEEELGQEARRGDPVTPPGTWRPGERSRGTPGMPPSYMPGVLISASWPPSGFGEVGLAVAVAVVLVAGRLRPTACAPGH